jgi:hypothetical protein
MLLHTFLVIVQYILLTDNWKAEAIVKLLVNKAMFEPGSGLREGVWA